MATVKERDIVSGRLVGIDETEIRIQLPIGLIQSYPYNGIGDTDRNIDLQCIFDNMGYPVVCLLEGGIITEIKPIGVRL